MHQYNIIKVFQIKYSQLDFYDKMIYQLNSIIIGFLTVFIPIRWCQDDMNLVIIDTFAIAIMLTVNFLLLFDKQLAAKTLLVISIYAIIIFSITYNGVKQLNWIYPASATIFFTMPPKKALIITFVLLSIVSAIIFKQIDLATWLVTISTVLCVNLIVFTFCIKVQEQLAELKILDFEAYIDSLSGLGNRRAFDEKLEKIKQTALTSDSHYFLILMDIDNFKSINDTHGHHLGDQVIKGLANILNELISTKAFTKAYRIGGEEFALIVNTSDAAEAKRVSESVRTNFKKKTQYGVDHKATIENTLSAGIAPFNPYKREWFKTADKLLYQAKREGKDRTLI